MIRTIPIPLTAGRLAQTPFVDESITYIGSTCEQTDPATGLCKADFFVPDTGGGIGTNSSGPGTLPGDPGLDAAVAAFANSTTSTANQLALNAGVSPSALLARSLASSNASIPGPGLGLVQVPQPWVKYFEIGAALLIAYILFGSTAASSRRSRA